MVFIITTISLHRELTSERMIFGEALYNKRIFFLNNYLNEHVILVINKTLITKNLTCKSYKLKMLKCQID